MQCSSFQYILLNFLNLFILHEIWNSLPSCYSTSLFPWSRHAMDPQDPRVKTTVLGIAPKYTSLNGKRKVWWPYKIITGWCKVAILEGNILKVFPIRIDQKNCSSAAVDNFSKLCACLRFGWMDSFHCLLFSEPQCLDKIFDAKDIWSHRGWCGQLYQATFSLFRSASKLSSHSYVMTFVPTICNNIVYSSFLMHCGIEKL